MVGGAIVRALANQDCEILTVGRGDVDLRDTRSVHDWMSTTRPQAVFLAAAKVGGILANDTAPVDFLVENLQIETAIFTGAHAVDVEKLLFLGSSCIYPKLAPQPLDEESLLTGPLEPTNEWYALAKIAGIKMAQAYRRQFGRDYISAMPTNLYGSGDNYDLNSSHVMPALIRKVHTAKCDGSPVIVWGTGTPRREFLYVDDCAAACIHMMRHYSDTMHLNVGVGEDVSILELTHLVMDVVGYDGAIVHDRSKPDGTPRKLMNVDRLAALGWRASTPLRKGIELAYKSYLAGDTDPSVGDGGNEPTIAVK